MLGPKILNAKVMHKRQFPKVNAFTYRVFYLCFNVLKAHELPLPANRFGLLSYHDKDHGDRSGADPEAWARNILRQFNVTEAKGEMILITMPRMFGYLFNPVSFWLCLDAQERLRAVICEVNNTFGETHSYLCVKEDQSEITPEDVLTAQKLFHVSPFLKREGHYTFRFSYEAGKEGFGAWIDFYDGEGKKQLLTALTGKTGPMTRASLRRAMFRHPLLTFKVIMLIHWQAMKLVAKGIKYIHRPKQIEPRISRADSDLTKL